MYIREIQVHNLKCFRSLTAEFPHVQDDYSGWVVLLGANGMGKSTLLQGLALSLAGSQDGLRLLQTPGSWLRNKSMKGEYVTFLTLNETESLVFRRENKVTLEFSGDRLFYSFSFSEPEVYDYLSKFGFAGFSCGYGPFRRLLGGAADESPSISDRAPRTRFLTLFRESSALPQSTEWLPSLYGRSLDPQNPDKDRDGMTLRAIREVLDSLMPGGVRVGSISTQGVFFRKGDGPNLPMMDLSDGYRSFLALVLDILRHLANSTENLQGVVDYDGGEPRITAEGVILIDEVDAHLHPFWQREIGFRLRRIFPKMQFIVSSHSPFVAQAASDGGLIVLRPTGEGGSVEAHKPIESVKGWRVDQILTSPLFGLDATRDEETEAMMRRHSELVAKQSAKRLSKAETSDLKSIETKLAGRLTAPGESLEEREREAAMQRYVDETLKQLGKTP